MKEILQQYAGYNLWANQRMVNCILLLPEKQQEAEVAGSFPSLHKTLLHMWYAGSIWWQRVKMLEVIIDPTANFTGTTGSAAAALIQQDELWESWVQKASLASLEHVFQYQNTQKEQFKQSVYLALMQVFNHGTYHRGQLVSMLHQMKVAKIPNTDFITWSRK